ncbi:MAG: mechanosensitive ion channel family protein [Bacteroidales bacterium]|nr:mechanosensitive ion channel family protein [Bacteroidales bacterium]
MTNIVEKMNGFLTGRLGVAGSVADIADDIIATGFVILVGAGINWLCQSIFRWIMKHNGRMLHSKWHPFLAKRKTGHHILMTIPGVIIYFMIQTVFYGNDSLIRLLHRFDIIYMIIVLIMTGNSLLLAFLDMYSTTDKNRSHPLQGLVQALQVILYFVGGIVITAILIDKSPTVLLTGLGASAAVLMLVFKDSILGFVAGVQLSQNNMIRIGDWIQMPDGSANGNVEAITLNTVKVRNWDNTITTIPPYTLVSTPFKNWRGMQESGGRRVDKRIHLDMKSLEVCSEDMIADICRSVALMKDYPAVKRAPDEQPTNSQLYRIYIERYLRKHPQVAQNLDLIIAQREPGEFGLPIEVYFFLTEKGWHDYEVIQSDIFDHLLAMAQEFGLKLYQLSAE